MGNQLKSHTSNNLSNNEEFESLSIPSRQYGGLSDNNFHNKTVYEEKLTFDLNEMNLTKRQKIESEKRIPKSDGLFISTVFRWKGKPGTVYICGSFNNWKEKILLTKSDDVYYTIVKCPPGRISFKFYKDGNWIHDDSQPTHENEYGTLNNYVDVSARDEDVDFVLTHDEQHSRKSSSNYNLTVPSMTYGQEIPGRPLPGVRALVPLQLPPYLSETILNTACAPHHDPNLLVSPFHVQLNHLYASSISSGVAALSVTVRHRTKHITTLFYKSITS